MSILSAKEKGVDSFMTVHDSFATHANDIDDLLLSLKEEFIALHQIDILDNLKKDIEKEFNIQLKTIKYLDQEFDLNKVKKAKYFFS